MIHPWFTWDKRTLKKKSLAKFIELKEKFDLCDIWRIRNPKTKIYTFRQKHVSDLIQRCLDYFYISNSMQVSIKNTVALASLLTNHRQLHFYKVKMKKAIEAEAFGNLITAWLKTDNMFTRWKKLYIRYFKWIFQWKHSRRSGKIGIFEAEAFGHLITAWLKTDNMFTRWKKLYQIL